MDFNKLFEQFQTTDSYAVLFFMIISFLLGFLVAYLLRSSRVRKLNKELKATKKELEQASAELLSVREQLELKEADLKKGNFEKQELQAKVNRLEKEKTELYNSIYAANAEQEKVKTSITNYIDTIESLNNQLVGLQTKNDQLTNDLAAIEKEIEIAEQNRQEALATTPVLIPAPVQDEGKIAEIESNVNENEDRLLAVEKRLAQLASENASLRDLVEELKENEPVVLVDKSIEENSSTTDTEPELKVAPEKTVLKDKIIVADHEKDDLTLIQGVGPFLEKKLNAIGIYTYEQISQFDKARIEQVTTDIAFFPGRIERDDWVGQAQKLMQMKKVSPDKFKEKKSHPKNTDDLKIIEGIGPKIEEILKQADINNWEDLAETAPKYLEVILADAGDRFKLHDPGTWPTQARLAARGEWNLLREYQDDLKGGREKKE